MLPDGSCSRERDTRGGAKRPKLLLDDANVPWAHAQQLLLRAVQPFEACVGVLVVTDAFARRFDADITVGRRNLQQPVDGALDGTVDRFLVAELVVRHLQQRFE
jgi:hypothetical protein